MIRRLLVILAIVLLVVGFFVSSPWNGILAVVAIASLIMILVISAMSLCP
jgi:hypothetical protein